MDIDIIEELLVEEDMMEPSDDELLLLEETEEDEEMIEGLGKKERNLFAVVKEELSKPLLTREEEKVLSQLIRDFKIEKTKKEVERIICSGWNMEMVAKMIAIIAELEKIREAARHELICRNLKLLISIAKRYANGDIELLLDIFQEGYKGLDRAAIKFDYHRGCKFSTYATWWINQAIKRKGYMLRSVVSVKSHMPEKIGHFRVVFMELYNKFKRDPSVEDLKKALRMSEEDVISLIDLCKRPISLDEPITTDKAGADDSIPVFGEVIQRPDKQDNVIPDIEDVINQLDLEKAIEWVLNNLCSERGKSILEMRFGISKERRDHDHTLEETGNFHNISRERARQLQKIIIGEIRKNSRAMRMLADFLTK